MDVFNRQGVGVRIDQEKIVVLMPLKEMSRQEALTHAAFLVTLAETLTKGSFDYTWNETLEAVQSS